ncbi:hypothetical protein GS454_23690 [Rhodococcus hoagii]|nr:hypothetical protein [Prescottella equi]
MTVALGTEDGVSLSADIRPQPGRTSPMSRITISPLQLAGGYRIVENGDFT